jgi:hypothetical protein
MYAFNPRAGRWSLAHAIAFLTATAVLGACSDETTGPAPNAGPKVQRSEALAPSPSDTKVELSILDKRVTFNRATGYASVRGAISCPAGEALDIVMEMQQNQRSGAEASTVSGSVTLPAVLCTGAPASFTLGIAPQGGEFESGNATVSARIANYQPPLEPTEVRRKVQVTAQ